MVFWTGWLFAAMAAAALAVASCQGDAGPSRRVGAVNPGGPLDPAPAFLVDGMNHATNNPLGAPGGTPLQCAIVASTVDGGPTLVTQSVPAVQQVLIDAGTRCVTSIAWTNEGAVMAEAQVYCGQYVTDAGGTAAAATVPSLQVRCPAGTICGVGLTDAPLCCAGATWYSSVDAGFLLTSGAPVLTLTKAALQ